MFWYLIYNRFVRVPSRPLRLLTSSRSFDATYLYQYTFIILYNVVFTSLPIIVLGGTFLPVY